MRHLNITEIEREAHQRRAEEMQHLFDELLKGIGKGLRSLFSWNPQNHRYH
jgi:hypothetical protein